MQPAYVPQIVAITGASGGFGSAFARRFAGLGCRLVLTGRRADLLEALAAEIDTPVHISVFDIRDRAATEAAFASLPEGFCDLDVLVNNAGLAMGQDPGPSANVDDWEIMIDTNNRGLVVATRAVLPAMVARGRGHIINIGSIAGTYPYPGGHVYCASKAFVKQFSLSLRSDLLGTGVRVTNIEPGMVETDFSLIRFKGDAERAAKVYADTTPLTAEDVAESVVWVATLPVHVNVNSLEVMPTIQACAPLAVHRRS